MYSCVEYVKVTIDKIFIESYHVENSGKHAEDSEKSQPHLCP